LEAIQLAQELGFAPVKVNAVVIRDINDHELESLAEFARERDLSFRFIEFMRSIPRGRGRRKWLSGKEILQRLQHDLIAAGRFRQSVLNFQALEIFRWSRRNRHHRSGERTVLRPLQSQFA